MDSFSHPRSRKGSETMGHPGPQRLKPVSLVCLNRSAEALRHPNSAAPTYQYKTGIDWDPGCSRHPSSFSCGYTFRKEEIKASSCWLHGRRLRDMKYYL